MKDIFLGSQCGRKAGKITLKIIYNTQLGYQHENSYSLTMSFSKIETTVVKTGSVLPSSYSTFNEIEVTIVDNNDFKFFIFKDGKRISEIAPQENTIKFIDMLTLAHVPTSYTLKIYKEDYELKSSDVSNSSIINNFEDMVLTDANNLFHIKYDPDISSFKYNTQDTITQTLGGKYPHIRRNGNMFYKTFNIGGLISYNAEYDYISSTDFPDSATRTTALMPSLAPSFTPFRFFSDMDDKNWNDLDEVAKERLFREALINFLYNDKVKLFKSPTEGNVLIRLTNVQLTPKKELGRMIYSFSAQATEIAEATYENLQKYGIQKEPEVSITDVSV